jgi:hypothetical protein
MQFIRSHYKKAAWFRIGHIDHTKISPFRSLSNGYARSISPRTIFTRMTQYLYDLDLRDVVIVNMGIAGVRIDVESDFHDFYQI